MMYVVVDIWSCPHYPVHAYENNRNTSLFVPFFGISDQSALPTLMNFVKGQNLPRVTRSNRTRLITSDSHLPRGPVNIFLQIQRIYRESKSTQRHGSSHWRSRSRPRYTWKITGSNTRRRWLLRIFLDPDRGIRGRSLDRTQVEGDCSEFCWKEIDKNSTHIIELQVLGTITSRRFWVSGSSDKNACRKSHSYVACWTREQWDNEFRKFPK